MTRVRGLDARAPTVSIASDPLWYKDAIIYELRVSSFFDSNGDGIGDFLGLEQKLDYLEDLGVTVLWLLPFYPSPLRDDGHNITDHTDVHPDMGTLDDFRRFLDSAHKRSLRVVTELVTTHTSDGHPWFQRARRSPAGSPERDFYIWSDAPQRFECVPINFGDSEAPNFTWDSVAQSYYWHRNRSHQPDLNYTNPMVFDAILHVLDFWLQLGVDGLRLDAIPHLSEREATDPGHLSETHDLFRRIRSHVDEHYQNRILLCEANQWPEETAAYFGLADECHMALHFPIASRLFLALETEDRFPLVDILEQTPEIPDTCQWALFLRNHDELTLETVTEEEREHMWRAYAADPNARINLGIRRRLAPLLDGNRARMELMTALLLSLPGTPVLYYGDEIAMGDNMYLGDRSGVRTPMQWSPDRNAGFSRTNPQRLNLPVIIDPQYHYEAVNVETQQANPESLLWWMKRVLALRKQQSVFGRGSITLLAPRNPRVLAFLRQHENETLLVVANFSRFVQLVEIDLRDYRGIRPLELFGLSRLGAVGRRLYALTIGPHGWYWLLLGKSDRASPSQSVTIQEWPQLTVDSDWRELLGERHLQLEAALPHFIEHQRWYCGKSQSLTHASLVDALSLTSVSPDCVVTVIETAYPKEASERLVLPLSLSKGKHSEVLAIRYPEMILGEVVSSSGEHLGLLHDAAFDRNFVESLWQMMAAGARLDANGCRLAAEAYEAAHLLEPEATIQELDVQPLGVQLINTTVRVGSHHVLKLLRRLEEGTSPGLELGRFLAQFANFKHVPATIGSATLRQASMREPATFAILQRFVPNVGDAWSRTQSELERYYRTALTSEFQDGWKAPGRLLFAPIGQQPETRLRSLIGPYLDAAHIIGRRTAEMHLCLACTANDSNLGPEPFTIHYQEQLYQGFRSRASRTLARLSDGISVMPDAIAARARRLIQRERQILRMFETVRDRPIHAERIRVHGDYHLRQLLCTGNDFVIINFEGHPARALSERRIKRCPLRDVAGMLRSFHYAAMHPLLRKNAGAVVRPADRQSLRRWAKLWLQWVSASFLEGYMAMIKGTPILPSDPSEIDLLLRLYLLEKALFELDSELGSRPDWLELPIEVTEQLLDA